MIGQLLTLVFGGGFGFLVGRRAERAREKAAQEAAGRELSPSPAQLPKDAYRAPDRTAVINLPYDAEDFEQLRTAVCEGFKDLTATHQVVTSDALRDWVLIAIYPDFQWPPVPGDPPQAMMMWLIADHEARKALASPLQCGIPVRRRLALGPGGAR